MLTKLGAYYEGQYVGTKLAECVSGNDTACKDETSYDVIRGCTTSSRNLSPENGWDVTSFQTYGF
jgi:polyamine oxidase